jgi:1-deoxy-D-xylulose-5-phosphate reductoisomerase
VSSLDIISAMRLDFEPPNLEKFPCLTLAIKAAKAGGSAPITLNASNEVAVDAFLNKEIMFSEIAEIVALTLKKTTLTNPDSLEAIQICDKKSREMTLKLISEYFKK